MRACVYQSVHVPIIDHPSSFGFLVALSHRLLHRLFRKRLGLS